MRKWLCLLLCLFPFSALADTTLILSFVGDCALADQYKYRGSATSFTTVTEKNGLDYPFSTVVELFAQDDLTIANCEGALTERKLGRGAKAMSLSAPPRFAQVFALGAVDVVNLSNNHSRDFGDQGLQDTREALDAWGIAHFGESETVILERKGVKIGLCGLCYPLTDAKMRRYQKMIAALRTQGCQVVIASAHAGREDNPIPNLEQRTCFPKLLDMGADIVYGHGAHVLHPVEVTEHGVILYSLGNFVFGANPRPQDDDTAVIQVRVRVREDGSATVEGLRALPMKVHDHSDYRPYFIEDEAGKRRVYQKLIFTRKGKQESHLPETFSETGVWAW